MFMPPWQPAPGWDNPPHWWSLGTQGAKLHLTSDMLLPEHTPQLSLTELSLGHQAWTASFNLLLRIGVILRQDHSKGHADSVTTSITTDNSSCLCSNSATVSLASLHPWRSSSLRKWLNRHSRVGGRCGPCLPSRTGGTAHVVSNSPDAYE